MQVLGTIGFAAKLYATFTNGLAYQFLPGDILSVVTCRDEVIYPLVARKMAQLHLQLDYWRRHSDHVSGEPVEPVLWKKITQFISLIPDQFSDEEKQEKFVKEIPKRSDLLHELEWVRTRLVQLGSPVVFCHNDLLLANILYEKESDALNFIDFEYAGPNYQSYDIANHFCEFAGTCIYEIM